MESCLLPHSTGETRDISNGMAEIITVEPEYKEMAMMKGAHERHGH